LIGILNGFVYDEEPTEEAFRATLERKRQARQSLASRFSDPNAFLLGFVGRAVEQKFRLLQENYQGKPILEHILDLSGVNVAILATGLPKYESFINGIATKRRPGTFSYDEWLLQPRRENYSCTIAFDRELARIISLGCDVFLMPSLFEPCGITQLESMSNATPPLVRLTGGLADTVIPHTETEENATGFGFAGANREEVLKGLLQCVEKARDFQREAPEAFQKLQQRAFQQRFEWQTAAREYVQRLYQPVMDGQLKSPF
jgi:starch synthase